MIRTVIRHPIGATLALLASAIVMLAPIAPAVAAPMRAASASCGATTVTTTVKARIVANRCHVAITYAAPIIDGVRAKPATAGFQQFFVTNPLSEGGNSLERGVASINIDRDSQGNHWTSFVGLDVQSFECTGTIVCNGIWYDDPWDSQAVIQARYWNVNHTADELDWNSGWYSHISRIESPTNLNAKHSYANTWLGFVMEIKDSSGVLVINDWNGSVD